MLSRALSGPAAGGPRRHITISTLFLAPAAALPLAAVNADLTVGFYVVAILIISLGVHEAAHAWVASLCGDSTAKDMGRMTLNPVPHIDPVMTILMPGFLYFISNGTFVFGGAKPVPVVYQRLRKPARDMMLVALAGPVANLLIAFALFVVLKALVYGSDWSLGSKDPIVRIFAGLLASGPGTTTILVAVLCKSIFYNVLLAAFNMIPLPPLDGSRVVAFLLPEPLRRSFQALDRFSFILILLLFYSGILSLPLWQGIIFTLEGFHACTGGYWI